MPLQPETTNNADEPNSKMNLSGILVVTTPDQIGQVCDALNNLEGVEVYHTDESTGRIVVVQEAETIKDEVAGLKRIKELPGIVMAEMIHHYFGDNPSQESLEDIPEDLDKLTGLAPAVSAYLNE